MARGRKKKLIKNVPEINYPLRNRRSSMKVNLSYISNLTDPENSSLKRTNIEDEKNSTEESTITEELPTPPKKSKRPIESIEDELQEEPDTPASLANITVINARERLLARYKKLSSKEPETNALVDINEKEQQLQKTCMELKSAIMYKTQAYFDKKTELAIKTTEVLATSDDDKRIDSPHSKKVNEDHNKRSPSVRVDIGKNDQIVMSGDGRKKNPVQINCMPDVHQDDNNDSVDCSQSIASTPKKSKKLSTESGQEDDDNNSKNVSNIPVARLFVESTNINSPPSQVASYKTTTNNVSSSKISSDSSYSTSPILSQGVRRSRLSLKRKLPKAIDLPRPSESFINSVPLTCSSFVEKRTKPVEIEDTNNSNKTINITDTSNSAKNGETITLDDNQNKTINVESTVHRVSSMEITTTASQMPIIRKSFQNIIRKSLKLNDVVVTIDRTHSCESRVQKQMLETNKSKQSSKLNFDANELQGDCSDNTVRTSLNVNTSLDPLLSIAEDVTQKENKKPNSLRTRSCNELKSNDADSMIQLHNTSSVVLRKLSNDLVQTNEDQEKNQNVKTNKSKLKDNKQIKDSKRPNNTKNKDLQNTSSFCNNSTVNEGQEKKNKEFSSLKDLNQGKTQSSTEIFSEPIKIQNKNVKTMEEQTKTGNSTGSTRSSMQVNTSLDSAKKSNTTQDKLNFNKINSPIQEKAGTEDENNTTDDANNVSSESENEMGNRIKNRSKNVTRRTYSKKVVRQSRQSKNNNTDDTNSLTSEFESESENISLTKRIKNRVKNITKRVNTSSKKIARQSLNSENSNSELNKKPENNLNCRTESSDTENSKNKEKSAKKSIPIRRSTRSTVTAKNVGNLSSNDRSIVEPTPFPTSRSFLYKTMIKNNIAANTIDPKQLELSDTEEVSSSDDNEEVENKPSTSKKTRKSVYIRKKPKSPKLLDTVLLGSSEDSSKSSDESDKEKVRVIINDSTNNSKTEDKSKSDESLNNTKKGKKGTKRKLLKENSQLVSFSPSEHFSQTEEPKEEKPKVLRRRRRRKIILKKNDKNLKEMEKENVKKKNEKLKEQDTPNSDEDTVSEPNEPQENIKKAKKKPRKIISKKFNVKNAATPKLLDKMMTENDDSSLRLSGRNSLREFDLKKMKKKHKENKKKPSSHRIIIVVTGLPKEDRDLVKSVIKALGSAVLELNVTPRTTHVISSGVRTINLLKGILRGCWLLSLEWALKSLEASKWLDPAPYEMCYFSKAVQENRRDRQLFGKAYVPELFVTSGFIYVENGTSPPAHVLKELIKTAGGRVTEDHCNADIVIGEEGLREIWVLDSITTGEVQPQEQYKRK